MHLSAAIVTIILVYRWGDWRNWKQYHSTLLYVALCNLLYVFFYCDHLLWKLIPDLAISPKIAEMLFTFVTLPGTTLLFLTNYPKQFKHQITRNLLFIIVYLVLEWLGVAFNKVEHDYGWTMWHSLVFDGIMFPLIALHHKKPLLAYMLSILFVILFIIAFPVKL